MSPYRRGPRSIDAALGSLADDLSPQTLLAEVQQVWLSVVGEAIAAEAQPSGERGGTITISCSASVWAQELDLMALQIIQRLNTHLSRGSVQRLRCVALGPQP